MPSTTPSARCCDKDFLSNTDIGQPTARIFQAPGCLKLDYKNQLTSGVSALQSSAVYYNGLGLRPRPV